jgi:hypothetical protein
MSLPAPRDATLLLDPACPWRAVASGEGGELDGFASASEPRSPSTFRFVFIFGHAFTSNQKLV